MAPTPTRWRTVAVAALAAATASAAACGDDDAENTAGGAQDADADALAFAECMRENGIDMPDPGPGQQGLMDALHATIGDYGQTEIAAAMDACQDLLPEYWAEQHGGDDDEVTLELADCLRDQGLDVSDDPIADLRSGAIDPEEFEAAMEECDSVLTGGDG